MPAQPRAEVPTVAIGQPDIKDDGVESRIAPGQHLLGFPDGASLGRGELAVHGKLFAQRLAQRPIIVHDQNGPFARH